MAGAVLTTAERCRRSAVQEQAATYRPAHEDDRPVRMAAVVQRKVDAAAAALFP
jgi:phosphoenolpyruvate synthase/pyruvate phosphate dikinase